MSRLPTTASPHWRSRAPTGPKSRSWISACRAWTATISRAGCALGIGGLFLAAMTGYGQEADREAARKAGFDVHLVKPVEAGPLRTLISQPTR